MIKHDFYLAGSTNLQLSFSDDEIVRQIAVLECVITYLNERKDSGIVLHMLYSEIEMFRRLAEARKLDLGKYPFFKAD